LNPTDRKPPIVLSDEQLPFIAISSTDEQRYFVNPVRERVFEARLQRTFLEESAEDTRSRRGYGKNLAFKKVTFTIDEPTYDKLTAETEKRKKNGESGVASAVIQDALTLYFKIAENIARNYVPPNERNTFARQDSKVTDNDCSYRPRPTVVCPHCKASDNLESAKYCYKCHEPLPLFSPLLPPL